MTTGQGLELFFPFSVRVTSQREMAVSSGPDPECCLIIESALSFYSVYMSTSKVFFFCLYVFLKSKVNVKCLSFFLK